MQPPHAGGNLQTPLSNAHTEEHHWQTEQNGARTEEQRQQTEQNGARTRQLSQCPERIVWFSWRNSHLCGDKRSETGQVFTKTPSNDGFSARVCPE